MLYSLARPLLFALDPERAHDMALATLDVAARLGIAHGVAGATLSSILSLLTVSVTWLAAALTANRGDRELDLVLLSTRTGGVIKNLTPGYTGEYESIHLDFARQLESAGVELLFVPVPAKAAGRTDESR